MLEGPGGLFILTGHPLSRCCKLLEHIFHYKRAAPGHGQAPSWVSSWVLTPEEWAYVKGVLSSDRMEPVLSHGTRVLKPLPRLIAPPGRLSPVATDGRRLRGPSIARGGGHAHNRGRQFFNLPDSQGFRWDDGVGAFEDEAQASFNQWSDDQSDVQ
ncbi:hypothetical protein FOA52_000949 [Chlamydomonas sp. UWO 241]|nr:hypothetical protein FOA52_000949 [Chlamydomonas sp. UWO 241]